MLAIKPATIKEETSRSMKTIRKSSIILAQIVISMAVVNGCEAEGEICEVVERRTLADDEDSPEGMSALDVLALAEPSEPMFQWDLTQDNQEHTNADPEATVSINLQVERGAGDVSYLVTEQSGTNEVDGNCGASLSVPVRLHMSTSDGGLDEEVFEDNLVYEFRQTGTAWIKRDFDFESLNGWLRPIEERATGQVYAEFGNSERGWIGVQIVTRHDNSVSEGSELAGHWGDVQR